MAAPRSVPCGITPNLAAVCPSGVCCPGSAQFDPDIAQVASDMAASILWQLTGRRFGACPVTVRPCKPLRDKTMPLPELIYWDRRGSDNLGVTFGWVPILDDGIVYNIACGCKGGCECSATCEFYLPGPVAAVTNVTIGVDVINPANYTVYDYSKLVFLGDQACPPIQNYDHALGEDDTWSVTYNLGDNWPAGADYVAGLLACEYGRALSNDSSCSLPNRVQSVARQGVDVAFVDPFALAEAGLTGIPIVDTWITAANPAKLKQPSRVWSPDLPVNRRNT